MCDDVGSGASQGWQTGAAGRSVAGAPHPSALQQHSLATGRGIPPRPTAGLGSRATGARSHLTRCVGCPEGTARRHRAAGHGGMGIQRAAMRADADGIGRTHRLLSKSTAQTDTQPATTPATRHDDLRCTRAFPRGLRSRPHGAGPHGQVFGLASSPSWHLLPVASQDQDPSAHDGVRSRSPLRGSSGFSPDSLLAHNLAG